MRQLPDQLGILLCALVIAITGSYCKKDKNENPPPPHDRWETINSGKERNIGTAKWSFVINDKAFFGSTEGDLHIYDFSRKDWTGSFTLPSEFESRWACAVAVHNNKAYIGNGRYGAGQFLSDWWEFDPEASNPWRRLPDCPVAGGDGTAFIHEGKLHNTLQIDERQGNETIQRRVYVFDLATESWSQNFNQVGANCGSSGFAFLLNNKLHFGAGYNNNVPGSVFTKECAVYNPADQQTTKIAQFPVEMQRAENAITFTQNGKGYVLGQHKELFEFDPAANKWREMNKVPEQAALGPVTYLHMYNNKVFGFTTKGKLYEYIPG